MRSKKKKILLNENLAGDRCGAKSSQAEPYGGCRFWF